MPSTAQFVKLLPFQNYVNTSAPEALNIYGNDGVYTDISGYVGSLRFVFVASPAKNPCPVELRIWQSQDGVSPFGDPIWFTDADLEVTANYAEVVLNSDSLENYILAQVTHYGDSSEVIALGVFMVGKVG